MPRTTSSLWSSLLTYSSTRRAGLLLPTLPSLTSSPEAVFRSSSVAPTFISKFCSFLQIHHRHHRRHHHHHHHHQLFFQLIQFLKILFKRINSFNKWIRCVLTSCIPMTPGGCVVRCRSSSPRDGDPQNKPRRHPSLPTAPASSVCRLPSKPCGSASIRASTR